MLEMTRAEYVIFALVFVLSVVTLYYAVTPNPDMVTAMATVILVVITGYYAWNTRQQVNAMKVQTEQTVSTMKEQTGQTVGAMRDQILMMKEQTEKTVNEMKNQADATKKQADIQYEQFKIIRDESATMKEQAETMREQSNLMLETMECDRLIRWRKRLNKEMKSFVGYLYERRNDTSIFKLQKRSKRIQIPRQDRNKDEEIYDFVIFWDTVDRYTYLNQSDNLRTALNNYNSSIEEYSAASGNQQDQDKIKENFETKHLPNLKKAIEYRFDELDKELKEIEAKINLKSQK